MMSPITPRVRCCLSVIPMPDHSGQDDQPHAVPHGREPAGLVRVVQVGAGGASVLRCRDSRVRLTSKGYGPAAGNRQEDGIG
jgi:hypothetical protein